jgi:hypothetical protein
MTPRQKVFALAEKLGATIEDAGGPTWLHFNIDAPHGMTWKGDTGLHCLVAGQARGFDTRDMWRDALDRMSHGIEPCEAGDECDFCHDTDHC